MRRRRQKLVFLDFSAESLAKFDQALALLDEVFANFIRLSAKEIRGLPKKGGKSDFFCRQTALVLDQNRDVLPPGFDIPQFHRDMAASEALASRLLRLGELIARGRDTEIALGSDILSAALDAYALMQRYGKSEGLELLREAMAQRNPGRPRPGAAEA